MRMLKDVDDNTTAPEQDVTSNEDSIIINVSLLIFSLVGAILSLLSIFVIARNRKLRKRTSNKFLLSLFSADFGVTLLMVIFHSILIYNSDEGRLKGMKEAKTFHMFISAFMFLSIINRITVTVDRAVAVKKPFFYQDKFNGKMVYCITVLQHVFAIIYMLVLVIADQIIEDRDVYLDLMQLLFISVISVGFVVLTVSNVIVYIEARKQIKAICKSQNSVDRKQCSRQKECKIVRINVGMVCVFVLCWIPFLVSICQEHSGTRVEDSMTVALYLVILNYILDPIIYVSLSRDVKDQIRKMLNSQKKQNNISVNSNASVTTVL